MVSDPKGVSETVAWVGGSEIAELAVLLRLVVTSIRRGRCPRHASPQLRHFPAAAPPLLHRCSATSRPLHRRCCATSRRSVAVAIAPPLRRCRHRPLLRHTLRRRSGHAPPPHSRSRQECAPLSPASPLAAALAAALPTLIPPLAHPLVPAHAPSLNRQNLSTSTATVGRSGCRHCEVSPPGSYHPC